MFFNLNFSFRRAIYLFIFGAFLFLLSVFFLRRSSSEANLTVKVVPVASVSRRVDFRFASVDFDSASYYRPIIENNLFRPLGWTPPSPVEPYRLVGTIFPRDSGTPPQAIIEGSGASFIISVGDLLERSTEVVSSGDCTGVEGGVSMAFI